MDTAHNIKFLERICLTNSLSTYDPYDVWKTSLGRFVKGIYFKNKIVGIIPAASLTIFDLFFNNKARLFYKSQEYPVVRAQAALSLMNHFKKSKNENHLDFAKRHIDWLLKNYSCNFNGLCWGTGFEIIISSQLTYDKNTPFTTNTPYILEALHEYYKLTQKQEIKKAILSIYNFYENDIVIMEETEAHMITSYGPVKDRIVTNAVSYTMYAYSIFYNYVNDKQHIENKIRKLYRFITDVQQSDGSWIYAPHDEDSFIDCFHSCFVLKNIYKTSIVLNLERSNEVINNGYDYLLNSFFDTNNNLSKRFSKSNKPSLVKFDLYDNAELLHLAKLIGDKNTYGKLDGAIKKTFIRNENIFSVIDIFGLKKNKNTYRWAVMPYLLAKSLP